MKWIGEEAIVDTMLARAAPRFVAEDGVRLGKLIDRFRIADTACLNFLRLCARSRDLPIPYAR
jgi:hypothetical protein